MVKKVYIDTSVVGGYFDEEFEFWTTRFFKLVEDGKYCLAISEILTTELAGAPERGQKILSDIPQEQKILIEYNKEARQLALDYIEANIVGKTSFTDCLHIATATINGIDILTSWNFKHIVNLDKIHLYNGVNLQKGYRTIEIRTPRELLNYENTED